MRKKQKKRIYYFLILIVVAVVIYFSVADKNTNVEIDVQTFSSQGAQHVSSIAGITYNSNPPTSGPHLGSPARAGFSDKQIPDGNLLHSLEHGYVVINYDCSEPILFDEELSGLLVPAVLAHGDAGHVEDTETINNSGPTLNALNENLQEDKECEQLKDKIKEIVKDFNWKVIANPRTENDHLISVTSWRKLMNLDKFNDSKIRSFITQNINKAPEKTPN